MLRGYPFIVVVGRNRRATVGVVLASLACLAACAQLSGLDDFKVNADGSDGGVGSSGAVGDGALDPDAPKNVFDGTVGSSADGSTLTNIDIPIFFLQTKGSGPSMLATPAVALGKSSHAAGCETPAGSLFKRAPTGPASTTANGPYRAANLQMRAYEKSSTQRALFAYVDGARALLMVDDQSDCTTRPPTRIDPADGGTSNANHVVPRFSPDGSRIAYLDESSNDIRQLVTVGVDGKDVRVVRKLGTSSGTGAGFWFVAPTWISSTELAWVERSGSAQDPLPLLMKRGADMASTTSTTTGTCNVYVDQVEVFQLGPTTKTARVASSKMGGPAGKPAYNISIHDGVDPCSNAGQIITNETTGGSSARDLAIAPGGSWIAFAWNADTPALERSIDSPAHIWIADTNGTAPPSLCFGQGAETDDFGPQWIENGTKLLWMHSSHTTDHEALWVADFVSGQCQNVRPFLSDVQDGGVRYMVGANAGSSCAMSRGGGSLAKPQQHAFGISVIGAMALMLRRQRRRRRLSASRNATSSSSAHDADHRER